MLRLLSADPGEMSDAAEVLAAIYDSLAQEPGGKALVEAVFGLQVREQVHCSACERSTHESSYMQPFYNVSATALRMQDAVSRAHGHATTLGLLLSVSVATCGLPCACIVSPFWLRCL
jgi:hypothetical protein